MLPLTNWVEALVNVSTDEYKLYRLIYYKALSSLMADAKTLQTTIILENNGYYFKATGSVITFDG